MSWDPGAHTGPSNDGRKNAVQTNCSVLKLSQDTCDLSVVDKVWKENGCGLRSVSGTLLTV